RVERLDLPSLRIEVGRRQVAVGGEQGRDVEHVRVTLFERLREGAVLVFELGEPVAEFLPDGGLDGQQLRELRVGELPGIGRRERGRVLDALFDVRNLRERREA